MNLGDPARKAITGNALDYYVNLLKETREKTLAEFRKRDDRWLNQITTAKSNLSKVALRVRNPVNSTRLRNS